MDSTMVIKVKYGETLRRFNSPITENGLLDLNMDGLRGKIILLFGFPTDADLTLTYIDEDGDVVTLVEDGDLRDVMRQNLKFLRINVQLSTNISGNASARSTRSSTPLLSPRGMHPLSNINSGVAEVLKSVPEPLRDTLSKLSLDLASKAVSSGPVLSELIESFNKLGVSLLNKNAQSSVSVNLGAENGASKSSAAGIVSEGSKSLGNDDLPEGPVNSSSSKKVEGGTVTRGMGAPVVPAPTSFDLNLPLTGEERKENPEPSGDFLMKNVSQESSQDADPNDNPFDDCPFTGLPLTSDSTPRSLAPRRVHPFKRGYNQAESFTGMFHRGVICDGCGVHPITGPRFKSKVKEDYDLCSFCFVKMGDEADYIRMDRPLSHRHPHPRCFRLPHDQLPWTGPLARPHDMRGCGAKCNPHTFNSCFISDVNVLDGTVMSPSTHFTKIWRMHNNGTVVWPHGTQIQWIAGHKFSDALSLSIEIPSDGVAVNKEIDIAVDFTAPELPGKYVSYWRLATPAGHKFGQRVWVVIQVDASSPRDSLLGSFNVPNLNLPAQSSSSSSRRSNAGLDAIDMNAIPAPDGDFLQPPNSNISPNPVNPVSEQYPENEQDLHFPLTDSLLVGQSLAPPSLSKFSPAISYPIIDNHLTRAQPVQPAQLAQPVQPAHIPSVSYPIIDFSDMAPSTPLPVPPILAPSAPSPSTLPPSLDALASAKHAMEEKLLTELEEMGFKQVDLNKEILRLNEYDLEQSVDDLCGVSEWDPILEELKEMGFLDKETNKKLLAKNNGSIKRVVMDLISGEKA